MKFTIITLAAAFALRFLLADRFVYRVGTARPSQLATMPAEQ